MNDLTHSERLEEFINFLKNCQREYEYHYQNVGVKDKETQDLLHQLELAERYEERVKFTPKLAQVRKERRKSKDTVEITEPFVKCMQSNKRLLNELQRLLIKVQEIEKSQQGRKYKARIRNDLTI